MKSSGKRKLSLMWTIISSLAMVGTASVATFAWFQASAAASVQTASTSTTITVNKPDDFTFYAYKGNRLNSWSTPGTFGNDFLVVTSSNLAEETSFSGFAAGQRYVYAIQADQAAALSIYISKIISNDASKQGMTYSRITYDGAHNVNVGWAIDIFEYEESVTHGSYPTGYSTLVSTLLPSASYGDRFNFSESTNRTVLEAAGTGTTPNKVITLGSSAVGIYDNTVSSLNYAGTTSALDSSKDTFVFFSVVFSNSDTTFYKEVKSNSDASEVIVSPTDRNRYFKKDSGGNSNLYAGLKFALSQIDIVIG